MNEVTPPTLPTAPLPEPRAPDVGHLHLLMVFYYVQAGLTCLGICAGGLYVLMGLAFLGMSAESTRPNDPPEAVGWFMTGMGGLVATLCATLSILYFLDARWIAKRRHPLFTQILAGFTCLSIPLGTALGIYTFVVMSRPGVRALYAEANALSATPITGPE